jgi:hypothetical protein
VWDVMQYSLIGIDILGQPIGPIFKGQAVPGHFIWVSL